MARGYSDRYLMGRNVKDLIMSLEDCVYLGAKYGLDTGDRGPNDMPNLPGYTHGAKADSIRRELKRRGLYY